MLNIARVRRRVLEGGHDVPKNEIVRRWTAAFENLLAMWDVFDRIHVLDSTSDTLRVIAEKDDTMTHTYGRELPMWAKRIGSWVGAGSG